MTLQIFKLSPLRPPEDPSWDLAPHRGIVYVRAETTGEARALAAEALEHGHNSDPSARVDGTFGSAFGDSNLYAVKLDEGGAHASEGHKGVVHQIR